MTTMKAESGKHADCPRCSGDAAPTGKRRTEGARAMFEMKCARCGLVFDIWRREWEEKETRGLSR